MHETYLCIEESHERYQGSTNAPGGLPGLWMKTGDGQTDLLVDLCDE